MDKIPPVQFLFRKPNYPVIVDIDGVVVCGRSAITLAKRLSKLINLQEKSYDAVKRRVVLRGRSAHTFTRSAPSPGIVVSAIFP